MMTSKIRSLVALAATTAATLLAAAPAWADDTELFIGPAVSAPPTRPNILFVLDTSGSMSNLQWTQEDYTATSTYTGSCSNSRIYWSRTGTPPSCSSSQWVPSSVFVCKAAQPSLANAGIAVVERAAQWNNSSPSSSRRWQQLSTNLQGSNNWVECAADAGIHGNSDSSTSRYARDGSTGPYTSTNTLWPSGGETGPVTFYTGNYLNWLANPLVQRSRLNIVRSAMNNLLDNLADGSVNVGLMRYSNDRNTLPNASDGGMVVEAMGPIESKRAAMKSTIATWVASGSTPLTETLYEASLYFRGERVFWGLTSDQCFPGQSNCPLASNPDSDTPSVAASRLSSDPTRYDSPADEDCQRNYIVYLTDGLPQSDSNSDAAIRALPNFSSIVGSTTCTAGRTIASDGDGTGQCLDELAKWMNESDLRLDRPGVQNITSYWIGFGDGVAAGSESLRYVAERGGGEYYSASDIAELSTAFTSIIARILEQTQTFTAPAVAVNAFNRTQNLNYLYMSLFKPAASYRWLGNVKKYRVRPDGTIVDAGGNAAVDPVTGFFARNSRSYWSDEVDGADAALGGAAGELTSPSTRRIYSNLTINSGLLTAEPLSLLKDASNLTLANTLLLGTTTPDASRPSIDNLVDWAYGVDVKDDDGDGDLTEARRDMGDPLHSRPATVVYGGPADDPLLILFATTNDGYLQAINAADGSELWSFIPRDLLGRIEPLYDNNEVSTRVYGLDGDIEVLRVDRNNNGTIEPAGTDMDFPANGIQEDEKDKVILFFGQRRGGSRYYAIDVTDRTAPRLLWSIGPSELPGIGQTWSTPTVARVNVARTWPAANPDKWVLVFGGGYDTAEDSIGYVSSVVGNGIYMVDAISGALIWRAGPDTSANLRLTSMTNAIPSEVRPLDLTGDGYADRFYAGDLGGRIWRFDINNGQTASSLVSGGVFARLGLGDAANTTDSTRNRRFFYAPDVSLLRVGTVNFINIAIGSGHRERPITDQTVVNRFYSLRDYNIFTRVASNQYKTTCGTTETSPCHQIITDDDSRLEDVTGDTSPTIPAGSVGWKLNFTDVGEKVLAEARTFQNEIFFPTYSPQQRSYNAEFCVATVGLNRLYVVDAATSTPLRNLDTSTAGNERYRELRQGSIAPAVTFVFPTPDADPSDPTRPMPAVAPFCLVGLENCGSGLANPPVRTYWEQRGAN
jgi:type IV pilus assembly protein PilY1